MDVDWRQGQVSSRSRVLSSAMSRRVNGMSTRDLVYLVLTVSSAKVRAANSLLSLTHSLKLLLLLADESQIVRQRTAELSRVRAEVDAQRATATELCDGLLHDEVLEGPVQAVAAGSGA